MGNEEPTINYTARELLERIEAKVDTVDSKFDGLSDRVSILELEKEGRRSAKEALKNWVLAAAAVTGSFATVLGVLKFKW